MNMLQPSRSRAGSILLLCLAIIAALGVLAYGFVRVAQLHDQTNGSANRQLLAREAALYGLNHAVEEIVRDYTTEPFTRLDGPAHATFVAHDIPYSIDGYFNDDNPRPGSWIDQSTPGGSINADVDSVSGARTLQAVTKDTWWGGGYCSPPSAYLTGNTTYDGRGRYYEPEFFNKAQFTAASGTLPNRPTIPVRFGTTLTTADPLPERSGGLFLDEHWRRISGDPRTARTMARYRVRYAVGVTDLDGEILINPDPAIDYRDYTASPLPADYGPGKSRIVRGQYALGAIGWARSRFGMQTVEGTDQATGMAGGISAAPRLAHIFLGRGFTSNFDFPAGVVANRHPVTFPLSYRKTGQYNYINYLDNYPGTPIGGAPMATSLFANPSETPVVSGNPAGGENIGFQSSQQLSRVCMGPQYSFWNFDMASAGGFGEAYSQRDGTVRSVGFYTPFGRGLQSGGTTRFTGQVDTPFAVNVMTAPPKVLASMVAAYMPPGAVAVRYYSRLVPTASYTAGGIGAFDLFVGELSSAFTRYAAPKRASPAISPDYHVLSLHPGDEGYRRPENRYPGILAFNGYGPNETGAHEWSHDTLGRYLRATGTIAAPVQAGVPDSRWTGDIDFRSGGQGATATATATSATTVVVTVNTGGSRYSPSPMVMISGGSGTLTGAAATVVGGAVTAITATGAAAYKPGEVLTVKITDPGAPTLSAKALSAHDPYNGMCYWQRYDPWQGGNIDYSFPLKPAGFNAPPGDVGGAAVQWEHWLVGTQVDSIWETIGQAMAASFAVARGEWLDYPTDNANPNTWFDGGPCPAAMRHQVTSIKELDRLFLANLGIDLDNPTSSTPTLAWASAANGGVRSFTPVWNLASLRSATFFDDTFGSILPGSYTIGTTLLPYTAAERTQAMEMIINDFRVSFFGSSPGYDDFLPLDLNGDGKINCSVYPRVAGDPALPPDPALARASDLGIDQFVATPTAVAPDKFFSSTGVFMMTRSRFWRVFVRGEVWDNLLNTVVTDILLESVIAVDPVNSAKDLEVAPASQNPKGGQYSTHTLFQRWHFDKYRGHLPRRE